MRAKALKKIIGRIAIGILVLGLLTSMIIMAKEIMKKTQFNKEPELSSIVQVSVEEPSTVEDNRPKAPVRTDIDWTGLKKQNGDVYAWISIPGTNVEYPVLQHPTENDYYLLHNLDKSSGYPGCIYSQTMTSKDFTDPNTILYGHCMKDGTMFKQLRNFEDLGFLNSHGYVYIYTEDAAYTYEIFNACVFNDRHLLYQYNFSDKGGFNNFLADLQAVRGMTSHYKPEVEVNENDRLLTLSTCVTADGPQRWLVVGVLRNKEKLR